MTRRMPRTPSRDVLSSTAPRVARCRWAGHPGVADRHTWGRWHMAEQARLVAWNSPSPSNATSASGRSRSVRSRPWSASETCPTRCPAWCSASPTRDLQPVGSTRRGDPPAGTAAVGTHGGDNVARAIVAPMSPIRSNWHLLAPRVSPLTSAGWWTHGCVRRSERGAASIPALVAAYAVAPQPNERLTRAVFVEAAPTSPTPMSMRCFANSRRTPGATGTARGRGRDLDGSGTGAARRAEDVEDRSPAPAGPGRRGRRGQDLPAPGAPCRLPSRTRPVGEGGCAKVQLPL